LREENERRATREDLEKHKQRLVEIKEKLQPPKYQSDQLFSTETRHGWSFGRWFFEHDSFRAWEDRSSPGSRVLFVHGKPGAGEETRLLQAQSR
jgi:hypothetical protein